MGMFSHIKEIASANADLLLPRMTVGTFMAALELQKHMPARKTKLYQFGNQWEENCVRTAKVTLEKMQHEFILDKDMALEVARRIYQYRCTRWTDANYVLSTQIPWFEIFKSDELPEQDAYAAWSFTHEYMNKNHELVSGLIFRGTDPIKGSKAKNELVGQIFDALEEDRPNLPAYRVNAMRVVVEHLVTRVINFMSASGNPQFQGGMAEYDFVKAVIQLIFTDEVRGMSPTTPPTATRLFEVITGIKETPDYNNWINDVAPGAEEKQDDE